MFSIKKRQLTPSKKSNTSKATSNRDTASHAAIIPLSDSTAIAKWASELKIEYLPQEIPELRRLEQSLYIAPVATLSQGPSHTVYGVFTAIDIRKGTSICVYLGEVHSLKESKKGLKKNQAYVYSLQGHADDETDDAHTFYVDATKKRSVGATVNSTLNQETANIESIIHGKGQNAYILYKASRDIPRHSQLLGFYGNSYDFDPEHLRCLHPSHSYQDTEALYNQNIRYYHQIERALPKNFEKLFHAAKFQKDTQCVIPLHFDMDPSTLMLAPDIDMVFLEKTGGKWHRQSQSEGITSLMMWMWHGNISHILRLIELKADLHKVSVLSGISPLHILMATPNLSDLQRKIVLETWIQEKGFVAPQNTEGDTPLHFALFYERSWDVIESLISAMRDHYARTDFLEETSRMIPGLKRTQYMSPFSILSSNMGLFEYIATLDASAKLQAIIDNLITIANIHDLYGILQSSAERNFIFSSIGVKAAVVRRIHDLFFQDSISTLAKEELRTFYASIKALAASASKAIKIGLNSLIEGVESSECFPQKYSSTSSELKKRPRTDTVALDTGKSELLFSKHNLRSTSQDQKKSIDSSRRYLARKRMKKIPYDC